MDMTVNSPDHHVIPISSLSPPAIPNASTCLKAVIALVFPYSSATKSAAFLIAESDFRLRRNKGQVRVQLRSSAAKAVAKSGIGIGDTVVLSLAGAKWAKDAPPISTPGRSVDGELIFTNKLQLEIQRGDQHVASITIDEPETEPETEAFTTTQEPLFPSTPAQKSHPEAPGSGPLWDSLAFLRSSQPFRADPYDPFVIDDGGSPGKGRKRTRFSGGWTYAQSSSGKSRSSSSSSAGDSSDREGGADHNQKRMTKPDANLEGREAAITVEDTFHPVEEVDTGVLEHTSQGDMAAEKVHESTAGVMEQHEVQELELDTLRQASKAQQTQLTDPQTDTVDQMIRYDGAEVPPSSPLALLFGRSLVQETRTPVEQVMLDAVTPEQSLTHDNAAESEKAERPPVSDTFSTFERLGELYTQVVPHSEEVHRSAPDSTIDPSIQDQGAQPKPQIAEIPPKEAPVIIDLISPTNDLPPSPPPSQPTSQIQELYHHPSLPTPETTSSRLSDMVASLTPQQPVNVTEVEEVKSGTVPTISIPSSYDTKPIANQDNQPDVENRSDAAISTTTQLRQTEKQTARIQLPEKTSDHAQTELTSRSAETETTQKDSGTAQQPPAETHTQPLSPTTAQVVQRRLQETEVGFRTKHSYYTPLSQLESHLNPSSQGAHAIDIMGVATETTSEPVRAKKGPKDFSIVMEITDFSRYPASVRVQVLRPYKLSLPIADIGDVVLLRNFVVKSQKRQCYLLSAETSAWVVWRNNKVHRNGINGDGAKPAWAKKAVPPNDVMRDECNGPPVEFGEEEYDQAVMLRKWWRHLNNGSFDMVATDTSNGDHVPAD